MPRTRTRAESTSSGAPTPPSANCRAPRRRPAATHRRSPSASSERLLLVRPVAVGVEVGARLFLAVAVRLARHAHAEEEIQEEHGDRHAPEHRADLERNLAVAHHREDDYAGQEDDARHAVAHEQHEHVVAPLAASHLGVGLPRLPRAEPRSGLDVHDAEDMTSLLLRPRRPAAYSY